MVAMALIVGALMLLIQSATVLETATRQNTCHQDAFMRLNATLAAWKAGGVASSETGVLAGNAPYRLDVREETTSLPGVLRLQVVIGWEVAKALPLTADQATHRLEAITFKTTP